MARLRRRIIVGVLTAALAAPAANAAGGDYIPWVTDFPGGNATKTFTAGVTDFPPRADAYGEAASVRTPASEIGDGGFGWTAAGGATMAALALALGGALALRRRKSKTADVAAAPALPADG